MGWREGLASWEKLTLWCALVMCPGGGQPAPHQNTPKTAQNTTPKVERTRRSERGLLALCKLKGVIV